MHVVRKIFVFESYPPHRQDERRRQVRDEAVAYANQHVDSLINICEFKEFSRQISGTVYYDHVWVVWHRSDSAIEPETQARGFDL